MMEALTNTVIGFLISSITWSVVAFLFHITMPLGDNLVITGIFTVVSVVRQYTLRRLFNNRSVWQSIKEKFI